MPWQSGYTSMDNNPIWFNDPMGDKVKAKLDRSMRKELGITRKEAKSYTPEMIKNVFQKEYGINVKTENGWLMSDGDVDAGQEVSSDARAMWLKELDPNVKSKHSFKFVNNSNAVDLGYNVAKGTGTVSVIDLGDFNSDFSSKGDKYWNVPNRSWNLGRVLEHEFLAHGVMGLDDDYPKSRSFQSSLQWEFDAKRMTGETVDFVNQFRKQINVPIRTNYGAQSGSNWKVGKYTKAFLRVGFDGGEIRTTVPVK